MMRLLLLLPTMMSTLLISLFASSLAFTATSAWVPSLYRRTKNHPRNIRSGLDYSRQEDSLDSAEAAEPLPLSTEDLKRLTEMKNRAATMPVVIMDSILPGQKLYFQSPDTKFEEMVKYVLASNDCNEIGIIGFNPHTGNPLNMGVTANINKKDITYGINRNSERVMATSFKGQRCFEVVGEPWMDDTHSFYIANVEIVDDRHEIMPANLEEQAMKIHNSIPGLVKEWATLVVKTDHTTPAELNKRLKEIGTMPQSMKDRAIWVGALVNPIPPLRVCVEIRPAMLACRNDHDRVVLASTALLSSIDHLSGKRKLF